MPGIRWVEGTDEFGPREVLANWLARASKAEAADGEVEEGPPTTGDFKAGKFIDADCLCPDWVGPLFPALLWLLPPA